MSLTGSSSSRRRIALVAAATVTTLVGGISTRLDNLSDTYADARTGLDQLTELLVDLDDLYNKCEPAERRILNRALFTRITIDDEENATYTPDETTASVLAHTNIDAPTEVTAETKLPRHQAGQVSIFSSYVELRGFEPLTFSLRTRRATNCAIAPCPLDICKCYTSAQQRPNHCPALRLHVPHSATGRAQTPLPTGRRLPGEAEWFAMSKSRRVRMSSQERREQLIDVARGLFADRGYDGTSVEEIAMTARVSKPIVYEHFGGKEGLYAVIVDREMQNLLGSIRSTLADTTASERELVAQAADALLEYVQSESDGFRILVRDSHVGETTGTFAGILSEVASRVEDLLVHHFRMRKLDPKTAPMYAQMLVGMVGLTGQWWLDHRQHKKEEVTAHVVNLAWNGLRGLEKTPPKLPPMTPEERSDRT